MNLQDVIQKLRDAQDAISALQSSHATLLGKYIDMSADFPAPPPANTPDVTGDSPTEKVPAVQLPPPQTFSGEHSA